MKPKLWIYCYMGVQLFCAPVFAEQIELNGMQSLTIADMLQKNGENDKAKTTYYALLNDPDYRVRTESVFRLAQIATNEQDYTSAIKYYLHILKYYPNSVLARLELARAYFMNGDYSLAEEQFLFARATPNLPEPIVKNIDTFLTAIRKQKNWSVESYFSFVPDSNLNYASGAGEECINSSFGVFCRPLEKQDSGIGIRFGADASYYLRFTKNFGLKSTLSISGLEYSSSRYDDYSLRLAVGPRYTFTNGEISLQPNIAWRWYQGAPYTNQYGLLLNTTWQFGRNWMLSGGVSWDKNSYINDHIDKFLSGNSVQLYIQPRYYFDNKSFLMSGLSFGHSSAKMDAYGYNSVGFALGYYNQWPLGFATFLRGDVSFLHFLSEKFFIMEDYNYQELKRSDVVYSASVRITNRFIEWNNFYPALTYTYIQRTSNIWSQEFDKHRVELEILYRF